MNMKSPSVLTACALLSVLILSGCYERVPPPELVREPGPPAVAPLVSPVPQYKIAGSSVRRRPIMTQLFGNGTDTTFLLATIHGNEPAGTPLLQRLAEHLKQNPQMLAGRTVVILPLANPDGLAANTRHNAKGVDLNRNFHSANRINNSRYGPAPLSEPEAQAIQKIIRQYAPDRIVSIHQPLACIDYDGPGRLLARYMAQHCDLPVKKLGAKPGSLGSYAGIDLGIPIVTFEMPQDASQLAPRSLWQQYGKALLAAIVYPGTIQ